MFQLLDNLLATKNLCPAVLDLPFSKKNKIRSVGRDLVWMFVW